MKHRDDNPWAYIKQYNINPFNVTDVSICLKGENKMVTDVKIIHDHVLMNQKKYNKVR